MYCTATSSWYYLLCMRPFVWDKRVWLHVNSFQSYFFRLNIKYTFLKITHTFILVINSIHYPCTQIAFIILIYLLSLSSHFFNSVLFAIVINPGVVESIAGSHFRVVFRFRIFGLPYQAYYNLPSPMDPTLCLIKHNVVTLSLICDIKKSVIF